MKPDIWVIIWYEWIGQVLQKFKGEVEVRCLEKPFGTCRNLRTLKLKCHSFYQEAYQTSVKPSSKFLKRAYKWVY